MESITPKNDVKNNYIPHDILLFIFSLMPFKSVVSFKCVCKAWHALINEFAKAYLKNAKETSQGVLFRNYKGSLLHIYSLQKKKGSGCNLKPLISMANEYGIHMLPSINGLVCLPNYFKENVFVCNPTTGEFVTLPAYNRPRHPHHFCTSEKFDGIGFGYSPSTNEYKVIRIFNDYEDVTDPIDIEYFGLVPFKATVLTLGRGGSWRDIDCLNYPLMNDSIYVNGFIYWPVIYFNTNQEEVIIVSFDVKEEKFRRIDGPPIEFYHNKLAQFRGKLCLIDYVFVSPAELRVDIWVLRGDDMWVREHNILYSKLSNYQPSLPAQISCFGTGKLALRRRSGVRDILDLYDIESKALEEVYLNPFTDGPGSIFSNIKLENDFEESLVSIGGATANAHLPLW